ncbi:MAG: pgsA [Ignavibacteria bacterium]|nr:pgsA [Ignavibacteria bacterium]
MLANIPNLISVLRLLLVIPLFFSIRNYDVTLTILLIVAAYITDLLDGWVARKMNVISESGKIIDPLADKIFVGVFAFLLLLNGQLPLWFCLVILIRDVLIFTGGIFFKKKAGFVPPSNYTGKVAVVSVGVSLVFSLFEYHTVTFIWYIISTLLLTISFTLYVFRMLKTLKEAK